MSWNHTYSHTVALGVDRLGAALIFNQPDITISSLCWIVLTAEEAFSTRAVTETDHVAMESLLSLKLDPWQLWLLRHIGASLERFFPGHCARARMSDILTGNSMMVLLGAHVK